MPLPYRDQVVARFWEFQQRRFSDWRKYFERPKSNDGLPPVYREEVASCNLLVKPGATPAEKKKLLAAIPLSERHRWFRSMASSQATTQSILGNLKVYEEIGCLSSIASDSGEPLFGAAQLTAGTFMMERQVTHLGDPRPTNLDAFVAGKYQVAVECKFGEAEVGACPRAKLTPKDPSYQTDRCDGTYTLQCGRKVRCALSAAGAKYWDYVPQIFSWKNSADLKPCPLAATYQLVRNILAVCAKADGTVAPGNGHVVLIYDERNPAFRAGGKGHEAYETVRSALKDKGLLRKCSWQKIMALLRSKKTLPWLTELAEEKYGL
jgi:hypothetical protein